MKRKLARGVLLVILSALLMPGLALPHALAQQVPPPPPVPHHLMPRTAAPDATRTTPPGDFPFQTATSADKLLIVHYYNRPAGYGQSILTIIEGYIQGPIKTTLGFGPTRAINIYIYNSRTIHAVTS